MNRQQELDVVEVEILEALQQCSEGDRKFVLDLVNRLIGREKRTQYPPNVIRLRTR